MDFGNVSIRATITWYAGHGKVGSNIVRCSRCDAKAFLNAWVNADQEHMSFGLYDQVKEATPDQLAALAYRMPCTGDRNARAMADVLAPALALKPTLPIDIAQIAREVVELTEE